MVERPGNSIAITGLDGGTSTYSNLASKIASSSGTFTAYLTSDSVTLTNLSFDCTGTTGNRQIVISFDLAKNAPTLGDDAPINESFTSTSFERFFYDLFEIFLVFF